MLWLEITAAGCALSTVVYHSMCIVAAWSFRRQCPRIPGFTPPVTILKPLRGADPRAYEGFRSHCLIDYPEYEVLYGASNPHDPAAALVARAIREFPERQIRLVICDDKRAPNRKVGTLAQMLKSARYEYLVINDSDIVVPPGYLREVISPLNDSSVGLVTSLYRGVAGTTVWSKLEALGITDFAAGVLLAYRGHFHYGFGSTLALSRKTLDEIGGIEQFGAYLADDYQLASAVAASGKEVVLAPHAVATLLPDYSFRHFWQHQIRWARTVRAANPAGYFGLLLTFGIVWSAVAIVTFRGASWAWIVLGATALSRVLATLSVGRSTLEDPEIPRNFWLLPLRVLLEPIIWAASWMGDTVNWRGEKFRLRDGKLQQSD